MRVYWLLFLFGLTIPNPTVLSHGEGRMNSGHSLVDVEKPVATLGGIMGQPYSQVWTRAVLLGSA